MNKKETEKIIQNGIEESFTYTNDWTQFLTQEHMTIIQKGIAKALKQIDYETIMKDFLTQEFESIYSDGSMDFELIQIVGEALRTHFINCKVIKPKSN